MIIILTETLSKKYNSMTGIDWKL